MTIGSALTGSYQHSRERLARLSRVLLTQQDIYHFREGTYVRAYQKLGAHAVRAADGTVGGAHRSEEHTSELQSQSNLVCRLLLEKKKKTRKKCSKRQKPSEKFSYTTNKITSDS